MQTTKLMRFLCYAGSYPFFESTTKVFRVMWHFTVLYIIISSSQSWHPNSFPQCFAGWVCLCKAHVLWMKWFVFLITVSHPFPLCEIQINTLPLAFALFTLLFCFFRLSLLVCCSHLSRILLLLLSLFLIHIPSAPLSSFPSSSFLIPSHFQLWCSTPAGLSVLVSPDTCITHWLKERGTFFSKCEACTECSYVHVCTELNSRMTGMGGPPSDIVLIMQRLKTELTLVCY